MQADRKEFADLLKRILSIDHKLRITPREALVHPFFFPAEQLKALRKQTWERQRACLQAMQERRRKAGEREDQTEGSGLHAGQRSKNARKDKGVGRCFIVSDIMLLYLLSNISTS
jgi:hypothetical protein